MYVAVFNFIKTKSYHGLPIRKSFLRKYHGIPFLDFYQRTTGESLSEHSFQRFKSKHKGLETLSHDRLQCSLQIMQKFGITAEDVCDYNNVHIFVMNPITMDNYGEILKECGFERILPKHIINYHTLVRKRPISKLKKDGLIRSDLNLQELLQSHLKDWSPGDSVLDSFPDTTTTVLTIRMSVLQKYLHWRLSVTQEEFSKYCRNYLPLKHKPMSDIQEALDIAQNDIKFDLSIIKRNGFIISSDPVNTKLIIDNVRSLAGYDIREVIKLEPAILKNNYNALLQIRNILEEYRITLEAQRRSLRVYCMCPSTVKERLEDLRNLKEYQILKTNPRVLSMVVHKKKMMNRLEKIQTEKKHCYSLNHLVSSSKVFNTYISNFGNKVCGRDLAVLIMSSLNVNNSDIATKPQNSTKELNVQEINTSELRTKDLSQKQLAKKVHAQLKRHKYWLHCALHVIAENIEFLKSNFSDDIILNNCLLLLYPRSEIEQYILTFQRLREGIQANDVIQLDANYTHLNLTRLSDEQILSLVLYEIEKKYHFSGDGIWSGQDGVKMDSRNT